LFTRSGLPGYQVGGGEGSEKCHGGVEWEDRKSSGPLFTKQKFDGISQPRYLCGSGPRCDSVSVAFRGGSGTSARSLRTPEVPRALSRLTSSPDPPLPAPVTSSLYPHKYRGCLILSNLRLVSKAPGDRRMDWINSNHVGVFRKGSRKSAKGFGV